MFSKTRSDGVVTKDNLGQWHPIVFFSKKMIPAKTWYKTHNSKLLAIVKVFKIWRHYLESCKHKVLVFTNHNNFCRFMDIKARAPNKSVRPKSSLATTFALITDRARPMELQMLYRDTLSKIPKKKLLFRPKIPRSFTGCSLL